MSDPLPLGKTYKLKTLKLIKRFMGALRNLNFLSVAVVVIIFGLMLRINDVQSAARAKAEQDLPDKKIEEMVNKSALFQESYLFDSSAETIEQLNENNKTVLKRDIVKDGSNELFSKKLQEIVGDAPISEMVPFISKRDEKVAAFLVGIAKKESSWGQHAPSQNGRNCHNYWGYKGSGSLGTGMGYACFASAEEAVEVVGNRIEVLINKKRDTPSRMVDTWKCGTTCKGDPGAPSWVATVALYFEKITS